MIRREAAEEEPFAAFRPLLCCVCCCGCFAGALIAAEIGYNIFLVYVCITTPYFGVLAGPGHSLPSSMPEACARKGSACFPGSIFDWILLHNAISRFILPLVMTWVCVHLLACWMTKDAAANRTARVVPPLLLLSELYLTVCGILMLRSVSKDCESVFQAKPYANLYWCFHVEVVVSAIMQLAQLDVTQWAPVYRGCGMETGTESGRDLERAAVNAEEEGRLLAEEDDDDDDEPPPASDTTPLSRPYAREGVAHGAPSFPLRRESSSIVELAADAHGQSGLSSALAVAALTRQPSQLSLQLSQSFAPSLQRRSNPETEGFV